MGRTETQILRALKESSKSFWELVALQDSTLSALVATIKRLMAGGKIHFNRSTKTFQLLGNGKYHPRMDLRCNSCNGKGLIVRGIFRKTLQQFTSLIAGRPMPDPNYNQGLISFPDLALKASFMYERGDLEDRSILLIGDDDLFSLYLGMLGMSQKILVLDIDKRILRFIEEKAGELGMNIETMEFDLSRSLPHHLNYAFDVFISEPPEGIKGMLTFLKRGIRSLAEGESAGYIGITMVESSLPKWYEVQAILTRNRLVITDVLRDFSLYPEGEGEWEDLYEEYPIMGKIPIDVGPPNIDWYTSCSIRFERVAKTSISRHHFYGDKDTWVTLKGL
ncbi:MAG: bis-aminopropyl spermidine synthase family protein [Syntrophobacterales bacterium]|nr:MAG: bis-aminopropyl spermidine synthase family protein [Syntrophobacterales bacterium]